MDHRRAPPRARPVSQPSGGKRKQTGKAWWPWFRRGASAVFFVLVASLLVSQARTIEWSQVLSSLQNYPLAAAWGAMLLALASFTLYSCFDLLGRHYTGHALSAPTVMLVTFISYAFNLNLGSLVGGVAFRFRLYSRLGLKIGVITRIMSLSMLANWMGYILLAGLVFSLRPPSLLAGWKIDAFHLRLIGIALLAVAAGYLAFCAFSRLGPLRLGGHVIDLPSLGLASLQLIMGAGNWLLMSGIIFILLQQRIEFSAVVSVLLLAAIAAVIAHIPAGLGVLEAVFVALLSQQMPRHDLLAALVAYRVIYYLAPLGVAAVVYLITEARTPQAAKTAA
ncbi:MAG TPA: lysylphosphatidylglycerol synthase domain-containing protein [Polaromonas sp.]